MAGFMDGITNMFHRGANAVRDAQLTPQEKSDREKGKACLELIKIASVVAFVATALIFAMWPNIFTFLLLPIVGLFARDVTEISNNILEGLNNYAVELQLQGDKSAILQQTTKNTLVLGSVIRILA